VSQLASMFKLIIQLCLHAMRLVTVTSTDLHWQLRLPVLPSSQSAGL